MITTVTLNAAIDKTYFLPSFKKGAVSRVQRYFAVPGGKGINVAKVVSQLGMPVTATGFVGGLNGEFIKQELESMGIDHDFVSVEGESRICLNIMDESEGSSTELLEPGPTVGAEALALLEQKIVELAGKSRVVVLSGSLPAGVPADYYVTLINAAKGAGAFVILDASGEALRNGLQGKPHMIKPNEDEVAALLGIEVADEEALQDAMLTLQQKYEIERLCVSLGGSGSITTSGNQTYRVTSPPIQPVNTVGCGDSFVAGMSVSIARELSLEEGLKMASAAGTANALSEQAGSVDTGVFEELLAKVEVAHK